MPKSIPNSASKSTAKPGKPTLKPGGAAARKGAAPRPPAKADAKKAVAKPVAAKKGAAKMVATKAVAAKAATKPAATKAASKPAATRAASKVATKPVATKPVATKPTAAKTGATAKAAPKAAAAPAKVAAAKPAAKPAPKLVPKAATPKATAPKVAVPRPAPPPSVAPPSVAPQPGAPKAPVKAAAPAAPAARAPLALVPARPVAGAPAPRPTLVPKADPPLPLKKLPFGVEDFVVYPTHGVGRVVAVETHAIAGMELQVFVVTFEKDKMTLRVPVGKAATSGMRKLSSKEEMAFALKTLKRRARIKRTMWSRRAAEYEAKINSGDPVSIAEVVRDLHRNVGQPDQSYSERQIYEAAFERLARELAAVEQIDSDLATRQLEKLLDAA